MEGGAAQEGLPARAAGCPSAHPCVPQDGALAPKPPLALPHRSGPSPGPVLQRRFVTGPGGHGGDTVPRGHRAFVSHPNCFEDVLLFNPLGPASGKLISAYSLFLGITLGYYLLQKIPPMAAARTVLSDSDELHSLNPTAGQGMLMNFPRLHAQLHKTVALPDPLPIFSELVTDLGSLLKDSCELGFVEHIIFHRRPLCSHPRHAPDLGSSRDNTNYNKRQLVPQRPKYVTQGGRNGISLVQQFREIK